MRVANTLKLSDYSKALGMAIISLSQTVKI